MTFTLFRNHFQLAYVTRDGDRALAVLKDKYGVPKWQTMDVAQGNPDSPVQRIFIAWAGDVMLELIEYAEGIPSVYDGWLKGDELLRFHHNGFWITSDEEMAEVKATFKAMGVDIPYAGRFGDILEFAYADTVAHLGHWYELVHLFPAGKDFFKDTPHND